MSLVFKKTGGQKKKFTEPHKLIYGFIKIGKSTLCAEMKDGKKEPLFVFTEDGAGDLDVYSARVKDYARFQDLVKYVKKNEKEVKEKHSCFVIDLVSDLDSMAEKYVCEKAKVKDLSDGSWGKLYNEHKKLFQDNITDLMDILPCVFVAHTKEKEINYQGVTMQTHVPTLSNRNFDFINGKVDVVGFMYIAENGKTAITFTPSKIAIAGSRYEQLRGKEFIVDPKNVKKSYEDIVKTFEGGKNE